MIMRVAIDMVELHNYRFFHPFGYSTDFTFILLNSLLY